MEPPLRNAALAAPLAGGFVLLAAGVGPEPSAFDVAGLRWLHGPEGPVGPGWLASLATAWTSLGGALALNVWIVLVGAGLFQARRFRPGVWFLTVSWGGLILGVLLKHLFARVRPGIVSPVITMPESWSFPSGHALDSTVVFLATAIVLAKGRRFSIARCSLLVAVAGAVTMGLTRVYLGVHYPTDVIAGWLAGAAWVLAATMALDPGSDRPAAAA